MLPLSIRLLLAAGALVAPLRVPASAVLQESPPAVEAEDQDLAELRSMLEAARSAKEAGDHERARATIVEAVELALERLAGREDGGTTELYEELGRFANAAGELHVAERVRRARVEILTRTRPADALDLQEARHHLALSLVLLGDLHQARELEEAALEVLSRTVAEEHPGLLQTWSSLAEIRKSLGDLQGARALEDKLLEVRLRTLPESHDDIQAARINLAGTLIELGELREAKALLEAAVEDLLRSYPEDHIFVQQARLNLAAANAELGDLHGARAQFASALEVLSRTFPDEHPYVLLARENLAAMMLRLGELHAARMQFESVLEARSRNLPENHPSLQRVRLNLALTLNGLGDLQGARALEESVLEILSRALPEEHPHVQLARQNLAHTLFGLGEIEEARALNESVLEVRSRTLPEDHQLLQAARMNLAAVLAKLGDVEAARALDESVLEIRSRTLPEEHPQLQTARGNVAVDRKELGDLEGALALEEQVLAVRSRTLPENHFDLQVARANLAETLARQAARAARARTSETEDAGGIARRERCAELIGAVCRSQVSEARAAVLTSSAREAEERCARIALALDTVLSFARGYGAFEPIETLAREAFALSETTRGAGLAVAVLSREAAGSPEYYRLRGELREASDALAALADEGSTSVEYHAARARREGLERELSALARDVSGEGAAVFEIDVDGLGARLGELDAVVAFRRYRNRVLVRTGDDRFVERSVQSLCAFLVRRGAGEPTDPTELEVVPLGPVEGIEESLRGWREAIGARLERGVGVGERAGDAALVRGRELRRLVWDPLVPALGNARRVIVALDDVLHLVPLDALPLEGGSELVGDRWRVETRLALWELLRERPRGDSGGALVALGGAAFNSPPISLTEEELASRDDEAERTPAVAGILRGSAWERGFVPLTYAGLEAREIAALHGELFEDEGVAFVLEKRKASRAALEELAPRARWLHVATHGWFAPESIRSWEDTGPLEEGGRPGLRLSTEDVVRGMSPMLLCGLALAGANLPEDVAGRAPGLITAEELSTLDLTGCELAVLSACDTNVGERRAGQGVASLQKALHMAGARTVITSLWKVPDEATRELMLDFYRRIWVEKTPKAQALWAAKRRMREARDESGRPRYTTRDWAGWVLTGEPD